MLAPLMFRVQSGFWWLIMVWLLGCRSASVGGAQGASTSGVPAVLPSPSTAVAPALSNSASAATEALPQLKPISSEYFPKGPSDEVLCEAIHSTDPNLWQRFGHFLPLAADGVIWIGDGSEAELEATRAAIWGYAPRFLGVEVRRCSTGGVLLYSENAKVQMRDSLQNEYSLAGLEAFVAGKVPSAGNVLREHFVVTGSEYVPTLLRVCERDPDSCEKILYLRRSSRFASPPGICYEVMRIAEDAYLAEDRSWAKRPSKELDRKALASACARLRPSEKICAVLIPRGGRPGRSECWRGLAAKMGL